MPRLSQRERRAKFSRERARERRNAEGERRRRASLAVQGTKLLPTISIEFWRFHNRDRAAYLHRMLSASRTECLAMLRDLQALLGTRFNAVTGIHHRNYCEWLRPGEAGPSLGWRRAIWLLWVMICRPGSVENLMDIATWGRFSWRHKDKGPGAADPARAGKGVCLNPRGRRARKWIPDPPPDDYQI